MPFEHLGDRFGGQDETLKDVVGEAEAVAAVVRFGDHAGEAGSIGIDREECQELVALPVGGGWDGSCDDRAEDAVTVMRLRCVVGHRVWI